MYIKKGEDERNFNLISVIFCYFVECAVRHIYWSLLMWSRWRVRLEISATTEIYRNNSITKFYKKLKMFFFDISNSTQHLSQWQPPDTSAETLSVTRLYKLPSLSTWIILFLWNIIRLLRKEIWFYSHWA